MGYNKYSYPSQERILGQVGIKKKESRFIELGCQQFWFRGPGINPGKYYRDTFVSQWKEIVSVDLTGPDWIQKHDLTKPLPDLGKFEVIADFGTAEHVGNRIEEQYMFWKNIHNLGKVGTLYLHDVPQKGNWLNHDCQWRYDMKFFADICLKNDYEIWEFSKNYTHDQGWAVFTSYIKRSDKEFMDISLFSI